MLGNKIDVFMDSIGYTIPEYLVNFNYVIQMLKSYDFELITDLSILSPPKQNVITKSIGNFKDIIDNLNNYYKYDKDLNDNIMEILEKPELIKLSSYYKYFIFQKK